jgi:predicted membrane GTPase involved in stress response
MNHFLPMFLKQQLTHFLGQVNILKINSGVLKAGQEVVITNKGEIKN